METIRYAIALIIAKILDLILRVVPSAGSEVPGRVALSIYPHFMGRIEKPAKVVCVTGTNGKSTVVQLIHDSMAAMEINILSNHKGSGSPEGVATALARGVTLFGRPKYATAALEVEPTGVGQVLEYVEPNIILINNIARERDTKVGNTDYIQQLITRSVPEKSKLVINGDDGLACGVAPFASRKFFGINEMPGDKKFNSNLIEDNAFCPQCKEKLAYVYNRYSNVGKAYCPECGYQLPEYDYIGELIIDEGRDVSKKPGRYLKVSSDTRNEVLPILQDSIYNIYNELAAVATMLEMGSRLVDIKNAFSRTVIDPDRMVQERISGKIITGLCMEEGNAYASSRVFESIIALTGDKEIVIMNNSRDIYDGPEDMSWLYDTDFEPLRDNHVRRVICCGERRFDYKLRLLLAGVDPSRISVVQDYGDSAKALSLNDIQRVFVLYGKDSVKEGKDVVRKIVSRLTSGEEKERRGFGNED